MKRRIRAMAIAESDKQKTTIKRELKMSSEKKELEKDDEPSDDALQNIPKVSKVIFDEKTGTITLQIAKEDEQLTGKKE
jgi:hypothetical protein